MKISQVMLLLAVCAGCSKSASEFAQGTIRIALPVVKERTVGFHDGGSLGITIRDAKGRRFLVYIDHGMSSSTPGAIYLSDPPETWGIDAPSRVRVLDVQSFKAKVGDFDERH